MASFNRPYRSHKVPACDHCRYRKVRCVLDLPGQSCRFCRERKVVCNYISVPQQSKDDYVDGPSSKRQKGSHQCTGDVGADPSTRSKATLSNLSGVAETSTKESSLIMNPHMAEDITILEQHLTQHPTEAQFVVKPYRTVATSSGSPIVYVKVPRKRKGLKPFVDPGKKQQEIIEQVLSPFADEVRKLYFDYLHPCFPILDEQTFVDLWQRDKEHLSSTLVCDMYASALVFWNRSDMLRQYARPDLNFVHNQAVAALQEDFMGPTISTVCSALLDMVGRPVGGVTGNVVNAGRVVTLAQSLGLHRDPTSWKATTHEKNIRIRLWWGVVIHDHWLSISHGIPPTVNTKYYDVPIVTHDMFATESASEFSLKTPSSFIHLCKLTRILGDVLPHVYSLRPDLEEVWKDLRKTECDLDDWLAALPAYLVPTHLAFNLGVNGASNLWFLHLSVKLLICRLAYKATLDKATSSMEARQYRLSTLRQSSCEVISFITSLNDAQLQEFWLPYTSYLLVAAATILLRCTIEGGDIATKRSCVTELVHFRDRLRRASEESGWELADVCLERCHEPIQKIAEALNVSEGPQEESVEADTADPATEVSHEIGATASTGDLDFLTDLLPLEGSLDHPWEMFWNTFDES